MLLLQLVGWTFVVAAVVVGGNQRVRIEVGLQGEDFG